MGFEALFVIGLLGIILTSVMGSIRFGHHAMHGGRAHHTGLKVPVKHLPPAGQHHTSALPHHNAGVSKEANMVNAHATTLASAKHFNFLVLIPSPLDIFSLCFGAGAAGLLATGHVASSWLPFIAVFGALLFAFGIVRPFFGVLMNFASEPSDGLEGTVAMTAEAITKFDAEGRGLVRVNMEGQLVQLLGRLCPEEIESAQIVRKGDQLVITEVDAKKGTCVVTREL